MVRVIPTENTYEHDPLYTADEAAEYLKVSKTTYNKLVREKGIPKVGLIADARYRRSDLNRLVSENVRIDYEGAH